MRTRALSLLAAGLVIVALDLRVVAVDVLPDVAGWLLVAAGSWKLALPRPAWLAVGAGVASAADVVAPYRYDNLDPITGEIVELPAPGTKYPQRLVFDHLHDVRLLLAVLAIVAGGLAVWSILGTLRRRADATGDDESARRLALLRWLVPSIWVAPYLALAVFQGAGDDGFDPVWNGGLELLALAGLAVVAGVVWVLATNSNRQWTATDDERTTPWAEMMVEGR
jgi:hypothetical protein